MSPKTYEFALTHYQIISLILINFLKDPELVGYFIQFLKDSELEEAQRFHSSIRTSKEERWSKTKLLSKERKFNQMNSGVPITCTLPFDGGMWRNSLQMLQMIPFFRRGILRKNIPATYQNSENHIILEVSHSIKVVNLIHDHSRKGERFRSTHPSLPLDEIPAFSYKIIKEAVNDFILFEDVYNEFDPIPMSEMPYILICSYDDRSSVINFHKDKEMYIEGIYN
jgi:hypothetical protein